MSEKLALQPEHGEIVVHRGPFIEKGGVVFRPTSGLRDFSTVALAHLVATQPWKVPYSAPFNAAVDADAGLGHLMGTHITLHASKTIGQIAAVFENLDHSGQQISSRQVQTLADKAADLVTAAMRLANLYAFDLAQAVVERSEEKNGVTLPDWGVRVEEAEEAFYLRLAEQLDAQVNGPSRWRTLTDQGRQHYADRAREALTSAGFRFTPSELPGTGDCYCGRGGSMGHEVGCPEAAADAERL